MAESRSDSSGQESTLCSQRQNETHSSSGESSLTTLGNKASIVRSSGTNRRDSAATLSERQTPLLIAAGLVKGTTLTFGRRLWHRGIPAGVSFAPDGSVADIPKADCLFSNIALDPGGEAE